MLSEKETTSLSKFLSLILRHKPETIQLSLDENGWADTNMLLEQMNLSGKTIDIDILKHIVATNTKKRFAFNEDCSRIRASQGHSVTIDLGYTSQEPPKLLYHGTAAKNIDSITTSGLLKGNRHEVHLSTDIDTAINVGSRHGKPVVFEIAANHMFTDGYLFHVSENGVWLTEHVPPSYIRLKKE